MSASWFAVWTRSRHEHVVREQIERKHFEAFLPHHHPVEQLEIARMIEWPLFPGYVRALRQNEAWRLMHRRRQYRGRRKAGTIPNTRSKAFDSLKAIAIRPLKRFAKA